MLRTSTARIELLRLRKGFKKTIICFVGENNIYTNDGHKTWCAWPKDVYEADQ